MKLLRQMILGAGMVALGLCPASSWADDTNAAPDFKEVYDLLRAHLAGQSEEELNRAAVQGLVYQLRSRASLVSSSKPVQDTAAESPWLSQSQTFDGPAAYLRISRVADGLAGQIAAAVKQLSATNKLKGVVVDLRFAGGHDYAAAAAAADVFIAKETPLLDWGNGEVKAKEKADAIALPVVVLVNRQTAGAAEALAAVLRESDQAVLLGATTAGEATIGKDFPLKNGQYLRIATASIKLGNGEALATTGVKPDVVVTVKPEDEKVYFADPFKELVVPSNLVAAFTSGNPNATNRPPRTRTSEADLIRERKERPGVELEGMPPAVASSEPDKPVVRDPVLARALDLIKGIAALRSARTP